MCRPAPRGHARQDARGRDRGSGGYGDGDGYGGGDGGDGDGGGDGGDGYGGGDGLKLQLIQGFIVQDGFQILAVRAGYSPYVLAGWVERHDFWVRVRNSRVVRRFGQDAQLAQIAKGGPKTGPNPTQLLDLSEEEWVPVASIARAIPGTAANWPMCPKPQIEEDRAATPDDLAAPVPTPKKRRKTRESV